MLEQLAALGPFFAVQTHRPGAVPSGPWRPVRELTAAPGQLRARITRTRVTLAARGGRPVSEIEFRVAASAVHLGLVARLAAPALGAAVLGWHLDMRPQDLWWQDVAGGPVPLSVPEPLPAPGSSPAALSQWAQRLLRDVIGPVTGATSRVAVVSARVLRGNAASGINAAAVQVAAARPDLAGQAWDRARALLADPWLDSEPNPPGPAFRRSSCCLFWRLMPGPGAARSAICGDCVLAPG